MADNQENGSALKEGTVPNDGTGNSNPSKAPQGMLTLLGVIQMDPWLSPFKDALRHRYSKAESWLKTINDTEGGLEKFSRVRKARRLQWHILTSSGNGEVWIQR